MSQVPKYEQVMSVIERRVREGDYLLHNIPGERKIAEETGVSYMTARRAVIELLDKKVLIRRTNGSLDVHPSYIEQKNHARVVMLYPAYPSPYLSQLRMIVTSALEKHERTLRPVQYVHWDDPIVIDALTNTGGTIVIPSADSIPSWILSTICDNKAVVLDGDFSEEAIPSIRLFPDHHIKQVFDHLTRLGHKHIDCVNTQHRNPEIDRRIDLWSKWINDHNQDGNLWDNPAPSFADPTPYAHEMMCNLIEKKKSKATAFVCTTFPAAIATVRAHWEKGYNIGTDISVCAVNIEYPARFFCPSITGLDMPDLSGVLTRCFEWFSTNRSWKGSPLLEPAEPIFHVGESTGKPT